MLLASRIAWRNEPVPVSLVFVTVNTKGATTRFDSAEEGDGGRSPGASVADWWAASRRGDCIVSCAERPNPTSAKEMTVNTIARPKKTCEPKKADREVGFFFMTRLLTLPRARNP